MSESVFASVFNDRAIPNLNDEFGVATVRLARGNLTSEPFTARRSARFTEALGTEIDVGIRQEQRQYLLPMSGCVLSGQAVRPRQGDYVLEGSDPDAAERWEVFFPDEATNDSQESSTSHDWITNCRRVRDDGVQRC